MVGPSDRVTIFGIDLVGSPHTVWHVLWYPDDINYVFGGQQLFALTENMKRKTTKKLRNY